MNKAIFKTPDHSKEKTSDILTISAIVILAILLILSYQFRKSLLPDTSVVATVDPNCDLGEGSCSAKFPNGEEISFLITPKMIPLSKPLILLVESKDIDAISVDVNLIGINMDTGINHSKLSKIKENLYSGSTIIPNSSGSKIEWEARVIIRTEKKSFLAPFTFTTDK